MLFILVAFLWRVPELQRLWQLEVIMFVGVVASSSSPQLLHIFYMYTCMSIYIYIYLRAAAPAADPGSKYGGLATFGYLLKQGNLGTNLRNILIAPCES